MGSEVVTAPDGIKWRVSWSESPGFCLECEKQWVYPGTLPVEFDVNNRPCGVEVECEGDECDARRRVVLRMHRMAG